LLGRWLESSHAWHGRDGVIDSWDTAGTYDIFLTHFIHYAKQRSPYRT
jgi:hypothetical protein